jgi:hypothetical protein
MTDKKDDRKTTEKKRRKSQDKKRQLKIADPKKASPIQFGPRRVMSDIDAPEGFLAVSFGQASMEYMKPLLELSESKNIVALNEVASLSMSLWNHAIDLEKHQAGPSKEIPIRNAIRSLFKIDDERAIDLFQEMIDRKAQLFPPEIQPKNLGVMFLRKEISHLIAPFNYRPLTPSPPPLPPDKADLAAVEMVVKMDQFIEDGTEYEEWEEHYFSMEDQCSERFKKWLKDKGLSEHAGHFAFYVEAYLNFIYRYMHEDLVLLNSVPPKCFEEFFFDYLLRKLMIAPHEYPECPAAVRFFYSFLNEKGYPLEIDSIMGMIDEIEPCFIEALRKRFG